MANQTICYSYTTEPCIIRGWWSSTRRLKTQPQAVSLFSPCREPHFWSWLCILWSKLWERNACSSAQQYEIFTVYSVTELLQQDWKMDACTLFCLSASRVSSKRLHCQLWSPWWNHKGHTHTSEYIYTLNEWALTDRPPIQKWIHTYTHRDMTFLKSDKFHRLQDSTGCDWHKSNKTWTSQVWD